MTEFIVAAPSSGSGKTTMTCALLAALKKRGLNPCAFKCGPDYIDPMFHRSVLGVDSHNLDLYLSDADCVRALYKRYSAGYGAAVVEGVMGLYDGVGGTTDRAGTWDLARMLSLPILLVVRPKGESLTLAASLRGLCEFREDSRIAGFLLNDCSRARFEALAPLLEKETGRPVFGFLPHMAEAGIQSRHLGLYTAGEIRDLQQKIALLENQAEQSIDLDRILSLCASKTEKTGSEKGAALPGEVLQNVPPKVRLAAACDSAFCFCYEENFDVLRHFGAEPVFFSPLTDRGLPEDIDGLYLPGGYPELYAERLSKNSAMRESIRRAVENGLPTVAECGGFLYLGEALQDQLQGTWPMAGVLSGTGTRTAHPVRFGYARLTAEQDGMLLDKGSSVPVHSFHYWDSTDCGTAFTAVKPVSGRKWESGFASETLYAAFEHLYFPGRPQMAERFVRAMEQYRKKG